MEESQTASERVGTYPAVRRRSFSKFAGAAVLATTAAGLLPRFLELSQTFEDTGVKAYKGQAGNLITSPTLLTAALRIHSVEARHAAEIRRLRGEKAWTRAFAEPLTKGQVLAMVSPFIRKGT